MLRPLRAGISRHDLSRDHTGYCSGLTNRTAAMLLNLHSGEAAGIQARKAQATQKQDKQTQRLMEAVEDDLRHRVLDFGDKRKG